MNSRHFLTEVWTEQGCGFGFVCLRTGTRDWRDMAVKVPDQLDELDQMLPDEKLGDVYFTPNLFLRPRRRKELMMESCWLYADLDEVDPYMVDERYEPTIAWQSSPNRYQALWWLRQHLTPETHQLLNRKLTYYLDADRGGWDATQVLRLPGTLNHKYESKPRVELLWTDADPVRTWKPVATHKLPRDSRASIAFESTDMTKLPAGIRAKLRARVAVGDRSKVLWRLERQLLQLGCSPQQVFALVKPSVWNKFESDTALWAEIERASRVKV